MEAVFELVRTTEKEGAFTSQMWKGFGYEVDYINFHNGAVRISVSQDKENKYLPHIHVRDDDEGHPLYTTIATTSYGSLSLEEYKKLNHAMEIAQAVAERIEAQFIKKL